jgi:hypothetical protein
MLRNIFLETFGRLVAINIVLLRFIEGKTFLFQAWRGPQSYRRSINLKVVRLLALGNGRLYLPGDIPGTPFCYKLSRLLGYIVACRIESVKDSNYPIGESNPQTFSL